MRAPARETLFGFGLVARVTVFAGAAAALPSAALAFLPLEGSGLDFELLWRALRRLAVSRRKRPFAVGFLVFEDTVGVLSSAI